MHTAVTHLLCSSYRWGRWVTVVSSYRWVELQMGRVIDGSSYRCGSRVIDVGRI